MFGYRTRPRKQRQNNALKHLSGSGIERCAELPRIAKGRAGKGFEANGERDAFFGAEAERLIHVPERDFVVVQNTGQGKTAIIELSL